MIKKLLALTLILATPAYAGDVGIPGQPLNQGQMIGGQGADGNFHFLLVGNDGSLSLSGGTSGVVTQGSTTAGQSGMLSQGAVTTANPTYTTAQTSPLSLDTAGNLRVKGAAAVAQGSTTSGQNGDLIQGAVTTAAPSYTTAQTSPLSLTTVGALRTDQSTIAGTTVDTNSGNKSAGTQRVVLATDQPNLTTNLNVKQNFRTTLATGQVTLSTTAGTMVAANATRRRCVVKNTDAAITITCGPATVTTGNGMPLKAGESTEFTATTLIQCIAASGTPVAAYLDESD